jgi:NADPH:quinone reductase-like Zn-dependent oxidoreductase
MTSNGSFICSSQVRRHSTEATFSNQVENFKQEFIPKHVLVIKQNDRRNVMPRAVRFNKYGGVDVLQVVEVDRQVPGPGQVLVRVKAAGVNPGEDMIRQGVFAERWPATFPSGQGSDLAGVVEEVGPGVVNVAVGDEVIGFTNNRASQAEFVLVESGNLVPRPANVPWEQAGALFVAGATAYAAVRAVALKAGDTVVISGAAGGVGSIAVQLARNAGAKVVGLAGEANHKWLTDHGVIPVTYGNGVEGRIRAAGGGKVDAFIDTFGGGYVELAIKLGVAKNRIDTIIDFAAAAKYGVKTEGNHEAANRDVLAQLAGLVAAGRLEIPIAKVYPLAQVRDAYRELEQRHTRGKIVLEP